MSTRAREELLRQSERQKNEQDIGLAADHQRSALLAAGFIPTGALVTALLASPVIQATGRQVIVAAVVALAIIAVNGLCWFVIRSVMRELREGPDIRQLKREIPDSEEGYSLLLHRLIMTFAKNYEDGKSPARRVSRWVDAQTLINIVAVGFLVFILLAVGDFLPFP